MCGIVGGVTTYKISTNTLTNSLNSIKHRGPDSSSWIQEECMDQNVFLGHRRLSILDLRSMGNQPMHSKDGRISIVFNGEVYNFKEIKNELRALNHTFTTETDTEVIVQAYIEWGESFISKCIGMFAFAIFDRSLCCVLLYRDRAGVKPLYYSLDDTGLLFASELKAMMAVEQYDYRSRLNLNVTAEYLKKGWIGAPNTIYNNTYKLEQGTFLKFNLKTRETNKIPYWEPDLFFQQKKIYMGYEDILNQTEELIKSACEYRMVSDVPVGVFLSGGYDSSLVASILQANRTERLKTFSIGFYEEAYNEAPYAKKVAEILGTDHHEWIVGEKEALSVIDDLAFFYDEPFGDSSAIPTMLVSKFASKSVKVALSADGGDEVFGGYPRYHMPYKQIQSIEKLKLLNSPVILGIIRTFSRMSTSEFQRRLEKIVNILKSSDHNQASLVRIEPSHFSNIELNYLFVNKLCPVDSKYRNTSHLSNLSTLDFLRCVEYQTTMVDDILVKVDRASMAYSLESREPLLDHRLVEWLGQLPNDVLHGKIYPKRLLRDICHKYIPEKLMNRPKKGFAIPTEKWMRGVLKSRLEFYTSENFIKAQGIFDANAVKKFVANYLDGKDSNHERPWIFLMYQMWWEKWQY
jgi:asparagine synthase (glutamine-hydrolysing)